MSLASIFHVSAFLLVVVVTFTLAQEQSTVVETTLGSVQGVRKTVNNRPVDVYYGIPFARPPVGDLRFKEPVPAEPWTGTRAAVEMPNSCFQSIDMEFNRFKGVEMWNPNTEMSEDCLYLNVWVPRGFGSTPPRTTMVWIYGGGFWAGTSTLTVYDATKLAATENVIVVSMNYRMGTLGFLYTNTTHAPGNMGLLDQVMALRWVHQNVDNFGGSPDSITIFGESAGAASVGFHLMSPLSMDYFSRAIMQSSSPLVDWGVTSNSKALRRSQDVAELVGCPAESASGMVECLRSKDAQNLTDTMWQVAEYWFDVPIAPVVDKHFLPDHPKNLMASGRIKNTEVIVGANKDEGLFFLLYAFKNEFPLDNSGQMSNSQFRDLVHSINFNADEKIDQAIIYKYFQSEVPQTRDSLRDIADDISGDAQFKCPVVDFATEYARSGHDVYLYSFEHRLSNNAWPEWTGVMHGYEVEAVFLLPEDTNYTQQDLDVASRMAAYWTRFAQSGDPNGQSDVWPKLTAETLDYLTITGDGDTVRQGLRHDTCGFRRTILPLLQQQGTICCSGTSIAFGSPASNTCNPSVTGAGRGVTGGIAVTFTGTVTVVSQTYSEIACQSIPTGGQQFLAPSRYTLAGVIMAFTYLFVMT
ncbi:hypothetical protein BaRGS_00009808 [Batillaria attramentaria]|uniref:Carboxylic ester hydrolase n=1 Tax=Batillaria attramentaria TaxID=370345 RepID=A0ABD0LJ56_9CAEN